MFSADRTRAWRQESAHLMRSLVAGVESRKPGTGRSEAGDARPCVRALCAKGHGWGERERF